MGVAAAELSVQMPSAPTTGVQRLWQASGCPGARSNLGAPCHAGGEEESEAMIMHRPLRPVVSPLLPLLSFQHICLRCVISIVCEVLLLQP